MSADLQIVSVIGANGQPLPIHGNNLGSNWSAPIKHERADEAEIQELATKMMESQKAALAKQQQQAAQMVGRQVIGPNGVPQQIGVNGQTNILNYLSRQQKLPNGAISSNSRAPSSNGGASIHADDLKKAPCDEESQKGHFGWTTFGKAFIPYIYRQQEKYCSVRMIEMKLLGKYLNCLHPDIYSSCTCVRSYYITEAEARLFIEINHKHCDSDFGRDLFTQKDLVVRLSDATKFYQFLDICYRKLISGSKSPLEKCGFIRINKESVVPYTVRNNEQVVPLFYFEGETENLKQKADYLSGWDLAYLKFCCKVQGIRNELFSSENVAVISLTDIKSYFPNGTEFEDYWPSKVVDSNLLIGNRSNATNSVNWTRQPSQPPPKVITTQQTLVQKSSQSAAAAAAAAQQQQHTLLKRGVAGANAFAAQSAAAAAAAAMQQPGQRMHSNALAQATVQALTNGSWMTQQQNNLPLIHAQMLASQAQQTHPGSRGQYRNPMENLMLGNRQPYTYNNGAISMQPVNSHAQSNAPPPLVRSAAGQNANHMLNVEQTMLQQTQQQQRYPFSSSTHSKLPSNSTTSLINISQTNPDAALSPAAAAAVNSYNYDLPQANSAAPHPPSLPPTLPQPTNSTDFSNLAFWNQLNSAQRLLLSQQLKNHGSLLGAVKNLYSSATTTFPPSLPHNAVTDLKSMLNYKAPQAPEPPSLPPMTSFPPSSTSSLGTTGNNNNSQFTKPSVPGASLDANQNKQRTTSLNCHKHNSNAALGTSIRRDRSAVSLNSSGALENFEKKFKMTDEMRAVVQKVLANPDLSTFIQTNSSNAFVPFISPPISPATTSSNLSGNQVGGNSSSFSIIQNPNVTITPQLTSASGHFSHPAVGSPHSPYSGGGVTRQKSVICSTSSAATLSIPPSPSTSASTPSPSPTRIAGSGPAHSIPPPPSASSNASITSSYNTQTLQHSDSPRNLINQQQQNPLSPFNQSHHSLNSHLHSLPPAPQTIRHTSPTDVIDLSSPRRSLQAASAYLQQQQQQQAAAQQQAHQAAAVAAVQQQQRMAAAAQHHSQQNGRSNSSTNSNSASMHLQRHAALAAAAVSGGRSDIDTGGQRLCVIPEIPSGNINMQPYKVQKVYVENHMVPCINMKAYNDSDQLMTLTDFQKYFFPTVPLDLCKRLIETLGVELYKGNRRQIQVLMENDRNHNENIPLVQVRDIIRYMTQLTFMIRNQEQPPSKRTRIS